MDQACTWLKGRDLGSVGPTIGAAPLADYAGAFAYPLLPTHVVAFPFHQKVICVLHAAYYTVLAYPFFRRRKRAFLGKQGIVETFF
jgi:hypothetical protein